MADNQMLDLLIEVLEEGISDEDQPDDVRQQQQLHQIQPVPQQPQHLVQIPSPVRSNSPLHRHLSSSSARRRIIKNGNCLFCRRDLEKLELEAHLRSNDVCFTLYKRKLHCNSIDGVLTRLYEKGCLFCNRPVNSFAFHLETNELCKQSYLHRYNVDQIK